MRIIYKNSSEYITNNEPRFFAQFSMKEIAIDDYALFAAYDDQYLYLIWEMINMSDGLVDSDFPIFQGNLLIYNLAILIF